MNNIIKKSIMGGLVIAAGVTAYLATVYLKNKDKSEEAEEEDDDIHFIKITDPDGEKEDTEESSEEVKEVCAVYPYLDKKFVGETLSKNEELDEEYAEDTLIEIKHRASFNDAETLEGFVQIMLAGGYECDEEDGTAIVSKKFYTQSGAIISDILNVSNQTAALDGKYLGYEII